MVKYQKGDRTPYVVAIHRIIEDRNNYKPLLTLQLRRIIERTNIKFDSMKPTSKKSWDVQFKYMGAANRALEKPFVQEANLKASIPFQKIICEATLRSIPLDMPRYELVRATGGFRLNRRVVIDGKTEWRDTFSVVVISRPKNPPEKVIVKKTILYTKIYVPPRRQCFNCGQLGHSKKFCKQVEKFLTCNEN